MRTCLLLQDRMWTCASNLFRAFTRPLRSSASKPFLSPPRFYWGSVVLCGCAHGYTPEGNRLLAFTSCGQTVVTLDRYPKRGTV